jgi:hypothetical protein
MTLSAGKLSHAELAAHVALINIYVLMIVFALGI